ncbi:hypothetical protein ABZ312_11515 [Streptomyces sp. NPDC006207]
MPKCALVLIVALVALALSYPVILAALVTVAVAVVTSTVGQLAIALVAGAHLIGHRSHQHAK